ncbi:MAG: C2HC-type zinc finger protein, partial [Aeromonas sp.]
YEMQLQAKEGEQPTKLYPCLDVYKNAGETAPIPSQSPDSDKNPMITSAMAFVRLGARIDIKPATMTDIDTICKNLPNPNSSSKFVDVLKTHTRYAQLTGADYRAILLRVLGDDVDEESLIKEVPYLNYDLDKPTEGEGTKEKPHRSFVWEDQDELAKFYRVLKDFLDRRAHKNKDLTFATNTKQNKGETASAFIMRFKRVWIEDAHIPTNNDMASLFINTCLNNMRPDLAQLIRVTTSKLHEMEIDEFCQRVRELDACGGFTFAKTKQEVMLSEAQPQMMHASQQNPKWKQRRGGVQNSSNDFCFVCGKRGHWSRDCWHRKQQGSAHDKWIPKERNSSYSNESGNKFQTQWKHKQV